MLKELEGYDWESAFQYTFNSKPLPNTNVSQEPCSQEDVEELYGISEGENDGPAWMCYGKLKDGRYFYLEAGCDYTGWDCQASGSVTFAETKEECESYALTEEARERMKVNIN